MTRSQKGLAGFFAFAGTMHFVIPRAYEAMMPPSLPRHREAVIVSGLAEIAGGAAVIPRRTRRFGAVGAIAVSAPGDALGLASDPKLTRAAINTLVFGSDLLSVELLSARTENARQCSPATDSQSACAKRDRT
jgi:hypothetical protein